VMAEIFARRTGLGAGDRESWWVDPEAAVAAELAAATNIHSVDGAAPDSPRGGAACIGYRGWGRCLRPG
jgi:hypothetical protein